MTTSSRSSSGPRLDNRCSRLLLPAVQFRFQATSGDASGLKAVKPEVCHEEQNTEATAVLPASEPDPSSPKPPDAGLSRRASLGDTFLDPAEDAQQALPPPDDEDAALTPTPTPTALVASPPSSTTNAGSDASRRPNPLRTARHKIAPKSEPVHVSCDSDDEFGVRSAPPPELSAEAVKQRMRRIFTPRADGSYLVAEDFVKQWADKSPGGGRDRLMGLFEKTAYHRAGPVNKSFSF